MNLAGTKILITGGSNGIGRALSKKLIQKGGAIYSIDMAPPTEHLEGFTPLQADIRNEKEVIAALKSIRCDMDLLVNNAGVMRRGTIFESSEEDFDILFGTHMKGAWLTLKHAKKLLKPTATIVNMSSRHGMSLPADPGLYALVKSTMANFSTIIKRTCPTYTVKTLFPGPTDTAVSRYGLKGTALEKKEKLMQPPEQLADRIMELLENDAKTELVFDEEKWDYYMQ